MFEEEVGHLALKVAEGVGFSAGVAVNGAKVGAQAALRAAADTKDTAIEAGKS